MEDYSKSEIELTEDEIVEALLTAYQRKEEQIKQKQIQERIHQNRMMAQQHWSPNIIDAYMRTRSANVFNGAFRFDDQVEPLYRLLCSYFCDDHSFYSLAGGLVVNEPSLEKGILIAGTFGVGKSWLMKLFQKQIKQVYYLRSAKQICEEFLAAGKIPEQYIELFPNPVNDNSVFQQVYTGMCIDDLGAENEKNSFGNKINVIGDLIEARYDKGFTGKYLHATTNLSAEGLTNFYGGRVTSRMKQIFNIIDFKGKDRRK